MGFKNYLKEFKFIQDRTPPNFSESLLVAEVAKLKNRYGFYIMEEPSSHDLDSIYQKLIHFFQNSSKGLNLSKKEWKMVAWAFMLPISGRQPLYENIQYTDILIDEIERRSRLSAVPSFIQLYLKLYIIDSESFNNLRERLLNIIVQSESSKLSSIKDWVTRTSLLEKNSHEDCSEHILLSDIETVFNQYKLTGGLEFGEYSLKTIKTFLSKLSIKLSSYERSDQVRIINSCLSFFPNDNELLKYPSLKADIANGLLSAFSENKPDRLIKEKLKAFFLHHYGDPRISKSKWTGVEPVALNVMKSWMVENTMHDFFNLLSHVAKTDPTAQLHWRYRKMFWNAYLKKGLIQEAWVALGSRAYAEADKFLDKKTSSYAKLKGGQSTHSSLIMIINGVLITEWSHSGSYRVWDTSMERPELYRKIYLQSGLTSGADYTGSHLASESGGWQWKLSNLIQQLTGAPIEYKEYMND